MTRLSIVMFVFLSVATASDITGDWRVEVKYDDRFVVVSGGYDCAFKLKSEQHFTGTCPGVTVTGDVSGNKVTWQMKEVGRQGGGSVFKGTMNANRRLISGRFTDGARQEGRFTASRK
jgi:hypothetical protein